MNAVEMLDLSCMLIQLYKSKKFLLMYKHQRYQTRDPQALTVTCV